MDTFFEQLIKRKKQPADYILTAIYIIFVPILVVMLTSLYNIKIIGFFMFPLQVLVVYAAYRLISSLSVEYEYAVTNGDVEIDKILNKQKRIHVVSVSSESITAMAPLGSDIIPNIDPQNITKALSGTNDATIYCLVYEDNGQKMIMFEPNQKIAEEIKRRNPRTVFLKD